MFVRQTARQDLEDQEEVANGKPGENHIDRVEDELDEEGELAEDGVVRPEKLVEVDDGVDGGEEGAVQPATALENQLGRRVGHVGLARRRLDVLQDPVAVALGDELEAENTILGEVHVGREDARVAAVQLLAGKVLLQWTQAVLVVLQRDVAVGREGTGQDRNEAKGRL
jgi:hypothetical protein